MKCITFLTSKVSPMVFHFSQYEIKEFIADRIIFIGDIERKGDLLRTIQLVKMRSTPHGRSKFILNMSSKMELN